eukprot:2862928-Lingulodinium_polyedra.AAC.1
MARYVDDVFMGSPFLHSQCMQGLLQQLAPVPFSLAAEGATVQWTDLVLSVKEGSLRVAFAMKHSSMLPRWDSDKLRTNAFVFSRLHRLARM